MIEWRVDGANAGTEMQPNEDEFSLKCIFLNKTNLAFLCNKSQKTIFE